MATKVSINHILKIIQSDEHHKLLDVFFVLAKISNQYKEEQTGRNFFIIYTESDSHYNLCNIIRKEAPYFKSRTTIDSCLNTLEDMNLLYYSKGEGGWIINEMDEMFSSGYMALRRIFFTKIFYDLNITEKKALVYAVYIMSTKNYKSVRKIMINLKDENSEWRKIFKSNNIYYLRRRIENIFKRFFRDISESKRERELEGYKKYDKYIYNRQKRSLNFKFVFEPLHLIQETLEKRKVKEKLEDYRSTDSGFYGYLQKLRERQESKIQQRFTDKIMLSLLSCCKGLKYPIQQEIAALIIKKLYDKNEIASPDKYIGKVVRTYLQEI